MCSVHEQVMPTYAEAYTNLGKFFQDSGKGLPAHVMHQVSAHVMHQVSAHVMHQVSAYASSLGTCHASSLGLSDWLFTFRVSVCLSVCLTVCFLYFRPSVLLFCLFMFVYVAICAPALSVCLCVRV